MIFRRYRDVSSSHPPLLGIIIATITLTAILISSPIIAVYSPSMVLKVRFTSAYATSENNDNDNNEGEGEDEPTTDGEEEVDGNVQEEDSTEEEQQQQQPSLSTQEQGEDEDVGEEEQEEEQQLATVVGEIWDDFEDNDGDGFIDLVDADCVAPLTQGTVTMSAPTTKINDNGGIATTYPDGIVVTNYPSGAVVTEYPDGTTVIKNGEPGYFPPENPRPDPIPGVTHTTYPDGTIIVEFPQGTWVEIPGFRSAAIFLNGTSAFIEEARGNMAPNQYRFQPPATEMLVFLILVHLRS